jgi:hypothetical protein
MANSVKGEVPLKLGDGQGFTLVMDMEALVEAEGAYGKPMAQMMADAGQGFVGASRALLYGALRAKHPDLTLRDASGMLASDGEAVAAAISDAVEKGFPDAKASAGGKVPHPRGKRSGSSGAKRV